jgi:hypothetical protein
MVRKRTNIENESLLIIPGICYKITQRLRRSNSLIRQVAARAGGLTPDAQANLSGCSERTSAHLHICTFAHFS